MKMNRYTRNAIVMLPAIGFLAWWAYAMPDRSTVTWGFALTVVLCLLISRIVRPINGAGAILLGLVLCCQPPDAVAMKGVVLQELCSQAAGMPNVTEVRGNAMYGFDAQDRLIRTAHGNDTVLFVYANADAGWPAAVSVNGGECIYLHVRGASAGPDLVDMTMAAIQSHLKDQGKVPPKCSDDLMGGTASVEPGSDPVNTEPTKGSNTKCLSDMLGEINMLGSSLVSETLAEFAVDQNVDKCKFSCERISQGVGLACIAAGLWKPPLALICGGATYLWWNYCNAQCDKP